LEHGLPFAPPSAVNRLIDGLPRRERERILGLCGRVELAFGEALCEADRRYRNVYFPLTAAISQVAMVDGHPPLELGLIGNEGMLGGTLALGVASAPLRAVVKTPGTALRMSATQLRSELRASSTLRHTLNRYLYVVTAQISQTAICSRYHEADARLARWLLLTHDRVQADHFHLTHQHLADMLGVQRSAVTIAAGTLQRKNLIAYRRGEIRILDRRGLEAASCECYAAVVEDDSQHFPADTPD